MDLSRSEPAATNAHEARVLVLGGHGFFGRIVVEDLLRETRATLVVAGRKPRRLPEWGERVSIATLDQHDVPALVGALHGVDVVVHAAGPYQGLAPSALAASVRAGVPYVDLAEDRAFVQRAEELVRASTPRAPVMIGMSFVPALCAALVERFRDELGPLASVRCIASPGSRGSRGRATLRCLLSRAGRRFELPRRNGSAEAWGWSQPVSVPFPLPIGRRTSYLAVPVADFDLFPRWFGCSEVEFRACSDQALLDRALWIAAGLQRCIPIPVLQACAVPLGGLVRLAGRFGTDAGAGMVELRDGTRTVRVAVVAPRRSERLPAVPAALAVVELLAGRLSGVSGLVPAPRALPPGTLLPELRRRGITTWLDRGQGWVEVLE